MQDKDDDDDDLDDTDLAPDSITLLTDGNWTVGDLQVLAQSVSRIYDSRLATFLWKQRLSSDLLDRRKSLKKSLEKLKRHLHGPGLYEWSEAWFEILEEGGIAEIEPLSPIGPLRISVSRDLLTPVQILQSMDLFADSSERCRIKKARMSSPGGFSFTGIGEIMKEARELIKDFWYRNRQEKEKGEVDLKIQKIDLIERYLSLESKLAPSQELIINVAAGVDGLLALEQSGKLKPVDKNIDKNDELNQ